MSGVLSRQPEPDKCFFCDGVLAMQSYNIVKSYPILFNAEKFSRCIELGTAIGGLAVFIRNYLKFSGDIITYDNHDAPSKQNSWVLSQGPNWRHRIGDVVLAPNVHDVFKECNVDFRLKDMFEPDNFQEIVELISGSGKTLLICDGGNKAKEIEIFSQYLKSGDIILGHDYFRDGIIDKSLWPVCELSFSMIEYAIKNHKLIADNEYTNLFADSITFIGIKE